MRIGVVVPTYDAYGDGPAIRQMILDIEALGYDSAWFGDHILVPGYAAQMIPPNWFEAMSCALVGIGMTSRLKFGTDVLVAPYRSPLLLAKMAATTAELAPGRLMLGLGIGYLKGEFEGLGIPPYARRGAVTGEYLQVMRTLFEADGAVSFAGEWVRFQDMWFGPKPAVPPPLLAGGNNDRALERAARLGDGWHPLFPTPEAYARGRGRIDAIRADAGLAGPFLYSMSGPQARILAPGDPKPAEWKRLDTPLPPEFGYAPEGPRAPDGRLRFIGTPEEVRADIAAYAAAGVEQLVLRFAITADAEITPDKHLPQLRRFAETVLPHIA